MKSIIQKSIVILLCSLFGLAALPAHAGFFSIYVFGDALSSTADNPDVGPLYYGQRYSNGRVWVEVLAQRQGLTYDATKNISYYDHNSAALVTDLNNFKAPLDAANDLFIVWVCNADTFDAASTAINSQIKDHSLLLNQFIGANIQSQTNHLQIIIRLYAQGVRTLVMPNVVDISTIPAFNNGNLTDVLSAGCSDYNARFVKTINQALALCPGLKIYTPDYFTLLNNVLANAAGYGLTNALINYGQGKVSIDAVDNLYPACNINGPGTNYIFWDYMNPTAKLHEVMADVAQQIVSPVQIGKLTPLNGNNRLDLVNIPVGLNGFVEGTTNLTLVNWTGVTNIASINSTQSIFVNASPLQIPPIPPSSGGPGGGIGDPGGGTGTNTVPFPSAAQFYRVSFPFAWSWP